MTGLADNTLLLSVFVAGVQIATPLLISSMGELLTERAGIWNLGVEGTMLSAAYAAYLAVVGTGSPVLALTTGIIVGAAIGGLTAFMAASMRLNHFITGLAINLLASGVTLFLFRSFSGGSLAPGFKGLENVAIPVLSSIPLLGPVLFDQRGLTYLAFALVPLTWLLLYKTRYGLELRTLGENPLALETKGLRVVPRLYLACVAGSALTGLGGAFLLLGMSDRFIPDISSGRGWLVVVALVAGNWSVWGTFLAVLVFALLESIASHAQALALPIPYQVLLALPYFASILLLTVFRFRSGQPARLGIPFSRT